MIYNHILREIRDSEILEVVLFHNAYYKEQRTTEQWLWEYKGNYPDSFVFVVSEYGSRIVGTQGMIPIHLTLNGIEYLTGKSENSLIAQNYPGKNLFKFKELYTFAISECESKNMCCVWGFTSLVSVWRKKLLFQVYEDAIYNALLIINLRIALTQVFKSKTFTSSMSAPKKMTLLLLPIVGAFYAKVFRWNGRLLKKRKKDKFTIVKEPKDVKDLERLYEKFREKYPDLIYIHQDEQYLIWRIFKNPNIVYKTFFVYEGKELRAYAYIHMKDNVAYITDLTYLTNEAGIFILRILLDYFIKEKIGIVQFLGNIKNELIENTFSLLEKFGFLKRKNSLSFVLKNISYSNEKELYDIRNWYLNELWKEGYYR